MTIGFWKKLGKGIAAPVTLPLKALTRAKAKVEMKIIGSIVRHALTTIGGALVGQGVLSTDQLETTVGAVVAIVGVVASVLKARKDAKAKD